MRPECGYPCTPPFDPSHPYPESELSTPTSSDRNDVYDLVRSCLCALGMDAENLGSRNWSPFRELLNPGNTVVVKPSLVSHVGFPQAVVTHASVVRPIVDYCWKALEGRGAIIVCDAPTAEADFDLTVKNNGLSEMIRILSNRGVNVSLRDLRALRVVAKSGIWVGEQQVPGGRAESVIVDVGALSAFSDPGFNTGRLHGGAYDRRQTVRNHSDGRNEYCVSKTILEADAIISVPKLKTHRRAGLTCCLKNLVGINVDKNYLAHYSIGPQNVGGDEFPSLAAWRLPLVSGLRFFHDLILSRYWCMTGRLVALAMGLLYGSKTRAHGRLEPEGMNAADRLSEAATGVACREGGWSGNETIWRMILDLNRLFLYARPDGSIADTVQRKVFHVVDGIVCGEGCGPLHPDPVNCGVVAAGYNAALIDKVLLDLAGIDYRLIPLYREALGPDASWLHFDLKPNATVNGSSAALPPERPLFSLRPPPYWQFNPEVQCESNGYLTKSHETPLV